ncbi:hypothetical protein [Rheinheimera aquimaris]|jgi:hypothetical protein|uniref:hypothetical protein n=2 Tax=Rheinheimera aquimaris TaxID=412437 RepID=UPI001064A441|nr:hypothetical protein [Rheinheimera aquimaris]|tara:strand:+ start:4129 stop:5979 length:1851 start_codon:yes stop_codon:yes gene_type:complete
MIKPQNSSSSDSKSKSILLSMEQNAGWLALFSYFITVWTFFIEQNNWTWRIAGLLISAVATILVFTRAIDYNGDGADVDENGAPDPVREDNYVMNGIFRFAYGFILLIGCVLIYLSISDKPLLFGSNELSAKDKTAAAVELTKPVPQQSQHTTTVAKTTTQAGLTEITTVHTDVKRNSDTAEQKPASKADESSIEDLLNTRLSSVVAIVKGCDYSYQIPVDNTKTTTQTRRLEGRMPLQAHCGDIPPQWVLSIGGNILACHILDNCAGAIIALRQKNSAPLNLNTLSIQLEHNTEKKNWLENSVAEYEMRLAGLELEHTLSKKPERSVLDKAKADLAQARERLTIVKADIANNLSDIRSAKQQIKMRQQAAEDRFLLGAPITGGVVVPVYFLILAILGALINMARKLPEFQRRVSSSYHQHYKYWLAQNPELALPMSGAYARETIVFQVVQVLCAPGVAIIAFSWAKPEEIGANIVLAFAAGFSSEMFLMAVRSVVERMIHGGTRKVAVETQYQLPTTKPAEVAQPVDMPPNPALQVYSLSLVPLQNNQKVKFVRVRQLPDGTVIELLTAGTIKKIVGNNITVSCEIKGKPVDVVVARGDIAPAEQVGTQQDDLKG